MSEVEFKSALHCRLRSTVKEMAGPSFDERVAAAASRMRRAAKEQETEQRRRLEEAMERARRRPNESAARAKEPESIEERTARGKQRLEKQESEYRRTMQDLRQRMAEREPIFRTEDVSAAFEELQQRQLARKQQLQEEEDQNWEHLRGIKQGVLERPLLVEAARPHDWALRRAEDARRRAAPLVREGPLDDKIRRAVSDPSFKESEWARTVQEIRDRMDARPKLHEISYPKKEIQPEVCEPHNPLLEKIEADLSEIVAVKREQMTRDERKQRRMLQELKEKGEQSAPLLGTHRIQRGPNYRPLREVTEAKREELAKTTREQWRKIRELQAAGRSRSLARAGGAALAG
eukprot:TRINITY_DN22681_c1_g4_i1.p1 TRINITY_DN22681_c1_g4~~TRINITY_DN22681_c1_g4_i1.p1  ORF type:complete len:371 (+),score=111.51 TRINITY_DN22681_c1_g4_i1:71-1114(+)